MKGAKQTTLRHQIAVSGIGVHSGLPVTLTLHPADDDTGIIFQRVSTDGSIEREIRADVRAVTATEFATVLGDARGPLCSTAEHLLAALRGLYVDNVVIEIDGPEVPIMDGSAAAFVDAIDQGGRRRTRLPEHPPPPGPDADRPPAGGLNVSRARPRTARARPAADR